jgi:hypothetical protein
LRGRERYVRFAEGKEVAILESRKQPEQTPSHCWLFIWRNLLRGFVVSVERFLRQRAVNVTVDATYRLPKWYDCEGRLRTFACRTTRVSPFRMIVDVPVVGKVGDLSRRIARDVSVLERAAQT